MQMPVERQTPDAGRPARGLYVPKSNDSPGTQFDSSCVEQEDEASRRGAEPSLEGGRPNNSHESEPQDAVGETPDATEIPLQNLQITTSITPSLLLNGSIHGHSVGMLLVPRGRKQARV